MSFDLNDAQPTTAGAPIPDGTFAKVVMVIRPGGVDGEADVDRGLLKRSGNPDSDVVMLDCEFTVVGGPYARRKFWQSLTVAGGKLDANGVSIGASITKVMLRAIHDSAKGLDPADKSEAARASRILRGFADFNGIEFVAKIKVEPSRNPAYPDRNRLERAVVPTEPEWSRVLNGEPVAAQPSAFARAQTPAAWEAPAKSYGGPAAPAWKAEVGGVQSATASTASSGPAWLKA
jgi:hypothetical protein